MKGIRRRDLKKKGYTRMGITDISCSFSIVISKEGEALTSGMERLSRVGNHHDVDVMLIAGPQKPNCREGIRPRWDFFFRT